MTLDRLRRVMERALDLGAEVPDSDLDVYTCVTLGKSSALYYAVSCSLESCASNLGAVESLNQGIFLQMHSCRSPWYMCEATTQLCLD